MSASSVCQGGIKPVWHRDLPPDAKLGTAIVTRQQDKWYIVFSVDRGLIWATKKQPRDLTQGSGKLLGRAVDVARYTRYKCGRAGAAHDEVRQANTTRTCSSYGCLSGPIGLAGLSIGRWTSASRVGRNMTATKTLLAT